MKTFAISKQRPGMGNGVVTASPDHEGGMAVDQRPGEAVSMQVPPDLAIRLSSLALSSGISPDAFLRQAISHWIEGSPSPLATRNADIRNDEAYTALNTPSALHSGFVPQPFSVSIYE